MSDTLIPGPDSGACPKCGNWRRAGMLHDCKPDPQPPAPEAEPDPLAGLPPDLAAILRDQSIIVPQDARVFELIAKWAKAPSDTASADLPAPETTWDACYCDRTTHDECPVHGTTGAGLGPSGSSAPVLTSDLDHPSEASPEGNGGEAGAEATPDPEASVDALVEIVMAGLQSGYHAGGHHPNCATREDEGCDCYARGSAAARSALVALAAHVRKLEEQLRHDGHGSPSFHLSTCPGCALLGSGEGQEPA